MPQYIALLRAINVSGVRIIKMEDLRRMFTEMGFTNVATYIQSGNIVFDAKERKEDAVRDKVAKQLHEKLGYEVEVIVRTPAAMQEVLDHFPYKADEHNKEVKLYVGFLDQEPDAAAQARLAVFDTEQERYHFRGKDLYVLIRKHDGKVWFSNNFIEQKLKRRATTRNWNTCNKLVEMCK